MTSVRARRRLPDASCGRHLREECRLARWGVLKGNTDSPKAGAECSSFLSVPFLLQALDPPLPPFSL